VRFLSSSFVQQSTPFVPLFTLHFFLILFRIRQVMATAGNQIFFAYTRDLKLGRYRPSIVLFIYIHVFSITVPLKDAASF
jgi:hypothetical protein